MRLLKKIRSGCSTAWELWIGLLRGPYWWLALVIMFLLPGAIFVVFLQAFPLVSPFVYTVF